MGHNGVKDWIGFSWDPVPPGTNPWKGTRVRSEGNKDSIWPFLVLHYMHAGLTFLNSLGKQTTFLLLSVCSWILLEQVQSLWWYWAGLFSMNRMSVATYLTMKHSSLSWGSQASHLKESTVPSLPGKCSFWWLFLMISVDFRHVSCIQTFLSELEFI